MEGVDLLFLLILLHAIFEFFTNAYSNAQKFHKIRIKLFIHAVYKKETGIYDC